MTYNLSDAVFSNDFYFVELEDGAIIALNIIDEDILSSGEERVINAINVVYVSTDGIQEITSNVIGIDTPYYTITTEHKEYLGKVLNKDNMKYCKLEVVNG